MTLTITQDCIQFYPQPEACTLNIPPVPKRSLVCCKEAPNKKGNKMYDEFDCCTQTPEQKKAEFLDNQLHVASNEKEAELTTAFKMDLKDTPEDPKELVQWVKDGWFKFDSCLNDDGSYRDTVARWHVRPVDFIRWNNPNRDTTGYDAARTKMWDAHTKAYRTINVGSPAEGLAALEAFESTTFH